MEESKSWMLSLGSQLNQSKAGTELCCLTFLKPWNFSPQILWWFEDWHVDISSGFIFYGSRKIPIWLCSLTGAEMKVVPGVYTAHLGESERLEDLLSILMTVNPTYILRITDVWILTWFKKTTRESKIPVRNWSCSGPHCNCGSNAIYCVLSPRHQRLITSMKI